MPLSESVGQDVVSTFLGQEKVFRNNAEEITFDENWLNDGDEIMTTPVPEEISVFRKILDSGSTEFSPLKNDNLQEIRGLAIKSEDRGKERILVQLFEARQLLSTSSGPTALLFERGTYTRLESPVFCLGNKLVCIVENDLIKFRSFYNLGRIIDTSAIFSLATDEDVESFADQYSDLFEIADVGHFVNSTSRNARKYMMSFMKKKDVLEKHTAQTLKEKAAKMQLAVEIRNDRIVMPTKRKDITELMRFINDGRYIGPISGDLLITNSQRSVPSD